MVGSDALESLLRQVRSPRVLHIATHGFFLAESDVPAPKERVKQPDAPRWTRPLRRANDAGSLEKRRVRLPLPDDGILTAEEASTLKLNGTWIVTLSACDTGSGEARSGEGVLGLRRGFIQAGRKVS